MDNPGKPDSKGVPMMADNASMMNMMQMFAQFMSQNNGQFAPQPPQTPMPPNYQQQGVYMPQQPFLMMPPQQPLLNKQQDLSQFYQSIQQSPYVPSNAKMNMPPDYSQQKMPPPEFSQQNMVPPEYGSPNPNAAFQQQFCQQMANLEENQSINLEQELPTKSEFQQINVSQMTAQPKDKSNHYNSNHSQSYINNDLSCGGEHLLMNKVEFRDFTKNFSEDQTFNMSHIPPALEQPDPNQDSNKSNILPKTLQNSFDEQPIKPMSKNKIKQNYEMDDQPKQDSFERHSRNRDSFQQDSQDRPIKTKETQRQEESEEKVRPNTSYHNEIDDIPIKPMKNQNFNQILEEQLKEEEERMNSSTVEAKKPRTFLKKGARQANTLKRQSSLKQDKQPPSAEQKKGGHNKHNSTMNSFQMNTSQHSRGKNDPKPPRGTQKSQDRMNMDKYVDDLDQEDQDTYKPAKYMNTVSNLEHDGDKIDFYYNNFMQEQQKNKERAKQQDEMDFNDQEEWELENDRPQQQDKPSILSKYFDTPHQQQPITSADDPYNNEEEIVKKYVNEKIEHLNQEITKFKQEREQLRQQQKKQDELNRALNKELEEMKQLRKEEQQKLQNMREQEEGRLKREKRLVEQKAKSLREGQMSRKDKEEVESLRTELAKVKAELQKNKNNSKLAADRMRKQYEELQVKNQQLQTQVSHYEKTRVDNKPPSKPQIQSKKTPLAKNKTQKHSKVEQTHEHIPSNNQSHVIEEITEQEELEDQELEEYSDIMENKSIPEAPLIQKGFEGKTYEITMEVIDSLYDVQDFSYDRNQFFLKYKQNSQQSDKVVEQRVEQDGRVQKVFSSGKREILFSNGVRREVFPDGYIIVQFSNQDIKQQLPDSTVIYYFHEAKTTQTTIHNGPNIYWFSNNQLEIHHPDGNKEIRFSDRTEKYIYPAGKEITFFTDNVVQVMEHGVKTIHYPNGQKDIIQADGNKLRLLPNGQKVYINSAGNVKHP